MSAVHPFLSSSGGSLITRRHDRTGRLKRASDDSDTLLRSSGGILALQSPDKNAGAEFFLPIERTLSCPVDSTTAEKNERENENDECESGTSSLVTSTQSGETVRTLFARGVTFVPPLTVSLETLEREDSSGESCSSGEARAVRSVRTSPQTALFFFALFPFRCFVHLDRRSFPCSGSPSRNFLSFIFLLDIYIRWIIMSQ